MLDKLICGLTICAVCAGCISDPFIDDCLYRLDDNPLSAEFELPPVPPTPVQPLAEEALVGEWGAVFAPYCRFEDGTHGPLNQISWIQSENYDFRADGGYHKVQVIAQGWAPSSTITSTNDEHGHWLYENGILTLDIERREITTKHNGKEIDRRLYLEREKRNCQVEWFADDELSIKDENFDNLLTLPHSNNSRTEVRFDKFGVKTVRIVCVTGMRDGKECGSVIELVYPPVHYKKAKKKD